MLLPKRMFDLILDSSGNFHLSLRFENIVIDVLRDLLLSDGVVLVMEVNTLLSHGVDELNLGSTLVLI